MSKLDELKKRERELLYQLEDNGKENYRTKELIETFEGYDRASHRYQSDLWEAVYQSRYAGQLEETLLQWNQLKNQIFEDLTYHMDDLKKEKFRLEGDLDAVYYERRKELEREEETRHGHWYVFGTITTTKFKCSDHVSISGGGLSTLQSAIQKFSEDTESLKGDAYDSARSFFASVLLPLSKGGQLYAETFSQAIKKLPADYQSMVDSKSWREDDLLDKIRQEEQMIAYLDEVNQSLSSLTMDSEEKGDWDVVMWSSWEDTTRINVSMKRFWKTCVPMIAIQEDFSMI